MSGKRHMKPTAIGYYLITLPDIGQGEAFVLLVTPAGKVVGATSCGGEHPTRVKAKVRREHARIAAKRKQKGAAASGE